MALRCFQKDEILNCDGYIPIANENYGFCGGSKSIRLRSNVEAAVVGRILYPSRMSDGSDGGGFLSNQKWSPNIEPSK